MSQALFKKTIAKWGERSQMEMAQEEATELALAIRKFIRKQTVHTFKNMAEEIADVEIMIEQIKIMEPDIVLEIENFKAAKISRLEVRVNENRFED